MLATQQLAPHSRHEGQRMGERMWNCFTRQDDFRTWRTATTCTAGERSALVGGTNATGHTSRSCPGRCAGPCPGACTSHAHAPARGPRTAKWQTIRGCKRHGASQNIRAGMHSRITPAARASHYEVGRQILLHLGCDVQYSKSPSTLDFTSWS